MHKYLPLLFLLLLAGCKNNSAGPANSASAKIDGVDFSADMGRSEAVVDARNRELTVTLRPSSPTAPELIVYFTEFVDKPVKYDPGQVSFSNITLMDPASGVSIVSVRDCGVITDMQLEVVSFSEKKGIIRGTFGGLMCPSSRAVAGQKRVSDGKFNMPFVVR